MKISVVMQSYLGDYPDSRKDPKNKFIRAVTSFLRQTHQDKELIIVSDGCEDTKKIYDLFFVDNKEIKFCYVSKDKGSQRMYELNNNILNYRGKPRALGVALSSGDIVTYFDSDDIMLPNRLSDLNSHWEKQPEEVKFASNPFRFLHINALGKHNITCERMLPENPNVQINLKNYGYMQQEFYLSRAVEKGFVFCASWALSHRKNINVTWSDTQKILNENRQIISGVSEDLNFLDELMKIGKGSTQESASIVICHYRMGLWDV